MRRSLLWPLLLLGLIVFPSAVIGQASNNSSTPEAQAIYDEFRLFGEETPLKITLRFSYRNFVRGKYKDKYQAANITVWLNDTISVSQPIRIKARGEFRRKYCYFPPIRLNFSQTEFPVQDLSQLKNLKLVTHCKNQAVYQQYLVKEYLAYKVFQRFTPLSFQVRLLEITYEDVDGKKKPFTRYGFVIEAVKQLAARNECVELEPPKVLESYTDRAYNTLLYVFQYCIGNTDWAAGNLHNFKLLKSVDFQQEKLYLVPYDFDYSGWVNASYAIPDPRLGIETVRDRKYRGVCHSREEVQAVVDRFIEEKENLYSLVQEQTLLESFHRQELIAYLDEFYAIVNSKVRFRQVFLEECRQN